MSKVLTISLKNNAKDVFLLFWSICLPLAFIIGFHYFDFPATNDSLFGIVTFSIFSQCCITQSFSIFSQRKRGVFELLFVTPFSIWKYLSSIVLSQAFLASVIAVLLLLIEDNLFSIDLTFLEVLSFIPLFFAGAILFNLLGFALSSLPKNESHLSIFTNLTMFGFLLPSSIFWTLDNTPRLVQMLAWINPFEWLQEGYRAIVNQNVTEYTLSFGVILVFSLVCAWIAQRTFRLKGR